jgi:hypothetical protein
MRRTNVCVFTVWCLSCLAGSDGRIAAAQERQKPTTRSDVLAETLWRVAIGARVPIGFEAIEQTVIPSAAMAVPEIAATSLPDILDGVLSDDGRYEWRSIENMIVVRPKNSWIDPTSPLNRQVHALQIAGASPTAVLLGLRDWLETNRFTINPRLAGTISFYVDSGTVTDALNGLVLASQQVMWVASFQRADRQSVGSWGVRFELRNEQHVTAVAATRQPVRPYR